MKNVAKLLTLALVVCLSGCVLIACGKDKKATGYNVYIANGEVTSGLLYFSASQGIEELEKGLHNVKKDAEIVVLWEADNGYDATLLVNSSEYEAQASPVTLTVTADTRIQVVTSVQLPGEPEEPTDPEDPQTKLVSNPVFTIVGDYGNNSRINYINAEYNRFDPTYWSHWSETIRSGQLVKVGDVIWLDWDISYHGWQYVGSKLTVTGADIVDGGHLHNNWATIVVNGTSNVTVEVEAVQAGKLSVSGKDWEISIIREDGESVHNNDRIELGKPFKFYPWVAKCTCCVLDEVWLQQDNQAFQLFPDANGWYTITEPKEYNRINAWVTRGPEVYVEGIYTGSGYGNISNFAVALYQDGKFVETLWNGDGKSLQSGDVSFKVNLTSSGDVAPWTHQVERVVIQKDNGGVPTPITPNAQGFYTVSGIIEWLNIIVYISEKPKYTVTFASADHVDFAVRNFTLHHGLSSGDYAYTGNEMFVRIDDLDWGYRVKSIKANGTTLALMPYEPGKCDRYAFVMGSANVTIVVEVEEIAKADVTFTYTTEAVASIVTNLNDGSGNKTLPTSGTNANKLVGVYEGYWIDVKITAATGFKVTKVTVNGQEVFFDYSGTYYIKASGATTVAITTAAV